MLIVGAAGYVVTTVTVETESHSLGQTFAVPPGRAPDLTISAEILSIDSIRQLANVKVDVSPGLALRGHRPSAPNRDFTLLINDGVTVRDIVYRAEKPIDPEFLAIDLAGGNIRNYPFDQFTGRLRLSTFEGYGGTPEESLPLFPEVSIWQGVNGWSMTVTPESASSPHDLRLGLRVFRSRPIRWFALSIFAVMGVIGAASLLVATIVFLGRRPFEFAMTNWMAAALFAIPAVRTALPGGPPPGVKADQLVFIWALVAQAISLIIIVSVWLRPPRAR
jgi:hypothetical protein